MLSEWAKFNTIRWMDKYRLAEVAIVFFILNNRPSHAFKIYDALSGTAKNTVKRHLNAHGFKSNDASFSSDDVECCKNFLKSKKYNYDYNKFNKKREEISFWSDLIAMLLFFSFVVFGMLGSRFSIIDWKGISAFLSISSAILIFLLFAPRFIEIKKLSSVRVFHLMAKSGGFVDFNIDTGSGRVSIYEKFIEVCGNSKIQSLVDFANNEKSLSYNSSKSAFKYIPIKDTVENTYSCISKFIEEIGKEDHDKNSIQQRFEELRKSVDILFQQTIASNIDRKVFSYEYKNIPSFGAPSIAYVLILSHSAISRNKTMLEKCGIIPSGDFDKIFSDYSDIIHLTFDELSHQNNHTGICHLSYQGLMQSSFDTSAHMANIVANETIINLGKSIELSENYSNHDGLLWSLSRMEKNRSSKNKKISALCEKAILLIQDSIPVSLYDKLLESVENRMQKTSEEN